MANEEYNYSDPSTQTADIAYRNKLRALRQASEKGLAPEKVASGFQEITGRPIGNTPTNVPYQQLRAQREVGAMTSTASKPSMSVPSMTATQPSSLTPYPDYSNAYKPKESVDDIAPKTQHINPVQPTIAQSPLAIPPAERGIYSGGVRQAPSTVRQTYPQALEAWHGQQRNAARENELGNVAGFATPDVGVVGQAYSNKAGTPSVNMGGMAPTSEVSRIIEGQQSNPYLRGSGQVAGAGFYTPQQVADIAQKNYTDWKAKAAAPMQERLPQVTPTIKQAYGERAAAQREARLPAERAHQMALAQEATKGQIGEAEAKQRGAEKVADIQAQSKTESSAMTNAEEMKAISGALGNIDAEANPVVVKALQDRLAQLAQSSNKPTMSEADARAKAKAAGMKQFKLGGKIYDV